jgi:hypothetical protein
MLLAATLLAIACTPAAPSDDYTLLQILDAIRAVETRGTPEAARDKGGDGGRAIGPFQIHWAYWKDAGVPGKYEDCRDMGYARRVVIAYWRRYCPQALADRDAEVLARTHNGGPAGAKRDSTLPFWRKVKRELETPPKSKPARDAKDPRPPPPPRARTEIA